MDYHSRIARIARHAARRRDLNPLIRSRVLEWINLAVGNGTLERVGADAILDSFDELLEGIKEANSQDIEFLQNGEPPLDSSELYQVVGISLDIVSWTLMRAFAKKISVRQYEPTTKVVVLPVIHREVA